MQYLQAVFAALFGVQSSKRQHHHFKNLSVRYLIVLGIVLTVAFVLTITFVVQLVVS